jgi:hypothetical protein
VLVSVPHGLCRPLPCLTAGGGGQGELRKAREREEMDALKYRLKQSQASPGRHCYSTLSLTATDCHSLGIYAVILLSLPPLSVQMTLSPTAIAGGEPGGGSGGDDLGRRLRDGGEDLPPRASHHPHPSAPPHPRRGQSVRA